MPYTEDTRKGGAEWVSHTQPLKLSEEELEKMYELLENPPKAGAKLTEALRRKTFVEYTRKDGSVVVGEIQQVYKEPHKIFLNGSLQGEKEAYQLRLACVDQDRIGHPVTIGASRCREVSAVPRFLLSILPPALLECPKYVSGDCLVVFLADLEAVFHLGGRVAIYDKRRGVCRIYPYWPEVTCSGGLPPSREEAPITSFTIQENLYEFRQEGGILWCYRGKLALYVAEEGEWSKSVPLFNVPLDAVWIFLSADGEVCVHMGRARCRGLGRDGLLWESLSSEGSWQDAGPPRVWTKGEIRQ